MLRSGLIGGGCISVTWGGWKSKGEWTKLEKYGMWPPLLIGKRISWFWQKFYNEDCLNCDDNWHDT